MKKKQQMLESPYHRKIREETKKRRSDMKMKEGRFAFLGSIREPIPISKGSKYAKKHKKVFKNFFW